MVGSASRRLATIGLTAVLVLLAGFSLWAAVRTNAAARQVDRDSAEQDVWQNARVALANVEAARHGYVEHRRTEARADVAHETRVLREALQFIIQHADPDDITFAQQVGTELERYQVATARQLAAVAAGDTAGASNTRLSRMRSPAYPTGRYCTTAPARPSAKPTGNWFPPRCC